MIYILWSLVQAPKPELGVSDKRDIKNEQDHDWYDGDKKNIAYK